jgi:hypothetical protein
MRCADDVGAGIVWVMSGPAHVMMDAVAVPERRWH